MKLIYYHLYKAISKIDLDRSTEWKALIALSLLLLFNLLTLFQIVIPDFSNTGFGQIIKNKLILMIICFAIYFLLYINIGRKNKSIELIEYYSSNTKYNTTLVKIVMVFYVLGSLVALYFATTLNKH